MRLRGSVFICLTVLAVSLSACRNFDRDLSVYCEHGGCGDGGAEADGGTQLVITTDPVPARLVAGRCELVRLFVKQANGQPPPTTPQAEISFPAIEGRPQPSINATNTCETPVSTVVIDEGTFSATIFISDQLAGAYEQPLQIYYPATDSIVTGSLPIEVTATSATKLSMTSAPDAGRIGACVGPFEVSFLDRFGNRTTSSASIPVSLTSDSPSASFFADNACANAFADGGATATGNGVTFFFSDSELGDRQVRASSNTFDGGTAFALFSMNTAPPSDIVLRDAPTDVLATTCSAPFTVGFSDPFGHLVPLEANSALTFSANSSGFAFFSDSTCTNAITTLPLSAGDSTATFHVRSPTANPAETLTIGMAGLTSATHVMTVTSAGAPRLLLSALASQPLNAGSCNPLRVTALLLDGGAAPVGGFGVNLAAPIDNDAGFFGPNDLTCAGPPITAWTFDAGTNAFDVKYIDTVAGTRTLKVSGPTLVSGSLDVSVAAGTVTNLRLVNAPAIVEAGKCIPLRVEAVDVFGNPTTRTQNLHAHGSTSLTSEHIGPAAGCGTDGDAVFSATDAGTTLYWSAKETGTLVFTVAATDGGATGDSTQIEVVPGDPAIAQLGPPPPPLQAAVTCSTPQYYVELRDRFGTPTTARTAQSVSLAVAPVQATGCPAMKTFSGSTCTTESPTLQIPAGSSRADFKTAVWSQSSCTYTVTGSGASLTPSSISIRVCRTLGAGCTNAGDCCSNSCNTFKCQ